MCRVVVQVSRISNSALLDCGNLHVGIFASFPLRSIYASLVSELQICEKRSNRFLVSFVIG